MNLHHPITARTGIPQNTEDAPDRIRTGDLRLERPKRFLRILLWEPESHFADAEGTGKGTENCLISLRSATTQALQRKVLASARVLKVWDGWSQRDRGAAPGGRKTPV